MKKQDKQTYNSPTLHTFASQVPFKLKVIDFLWRPLNICTFHFFSSWVYKDFVVIPLVDPRITP